MDCVMQQLGNNNFFKYKYKFQLHRRGFILFRNVQIITSATLYYYQDWNIIS